MLAGVQKRKTSEPEAVNKCGKRTKGRGLGTKWEFYKPEPVRISCWLVCKNVKLVNLRQ